MPKRVYYTEALLSDGTFLSHFIPQFCYYLNTTFINSPDYLTYLANARNADKLWFGYSGPHASYEWGLGEALTSPYRFPMGTTTVTATATNGCGSDSKTFIVTVQDRQAPTVRTRNISVALASGTATIVAGQLNDGSSDNCSGPLTYSVSPSTFSCANIGLNSVTLTVTDASGNQATGTATVTVTGTVPVPTIRVIPSSATYTGTAATLSLTGRPAGIYSCAAARSTSASWWSSAGSGPNVTLAGYVFSP